MRMMMKAAVVAALAATAAFGAEVVDLNDGWTRTVGAETATVDLPDDFRINLPWDRGASAGRGFKAETNGVYRRTFFADPKWRGRKVSVAVDGAQDRCEVRLNGKTVGAGDYGSLGFEADVSDALAFGRENELEIRCENGGVRSCRWYTGCGITRGVRLVIRGRTSFVRHGLSVTTPVAGPDRATVRVLAEIAGWCYVTNGTAAVTATVFAPDGREVGRARKELDRCKGLFAEVTLPEIEVRDPELWDVDSPRLYRVTAAVERDGAVTDTAERRFGIRRIEYSKDFGFRLNGRKVFLKGMSNHQHLGALGEASFPRAWRRQLAVMKEFGYNAIRCSHNPYPDELLDLCDEMGVLVVDELVDKWRGCWPGVKPFFEQAGALVREWIRRDRSHPSVILWSVGNETQSGMYCLPLDYGDWGVTEYRVLDALVKRWDMTRPTTAAMFPARAGAVTSREPTFRTRVIPPELSCITEVASFNYVPSDYAAYRRYAPHLIVFQSEAAVNALARAYYLMDYDTSVGISYWGAIEYWGESDGWPKKGWNYSFFRRTLDPLPQAWLIRSVFRSAEEEPVVRLGVKFAATERVSWNDVDVGSMRLASSWNFAPGTKRSVYAFSNGDSVELLLNGRSLGRKDNETGNTDRRNMFIWDGVAFEPGAIEAVAFKGDREIARHRLETSGEAVGIRLEAESSGDWRADGRDLQYVRVTAVDARGRCVPDAKGELRFSVTGAAKLLAVDDGDAYTDRLFNGGATKLYAGKALAILRATHAAGEAVLTVDAGPLGRAQLKLASR